MSLFDQFAWRFGGRLHQVDTYYHAHSWVPDFIGERACDLFDVSLGAGSYQQIRTERKNREST